ncbi:MAG: hypothetical protein DDT18_02006 [Actinobacteria bacterium]|nr:hypothetical protein [Actinomycetota bacterium]
MEKKYRRTKLSEAECFQHGNDNYWFRPLVFGENIFTYIAYVPPGGDMPSHEDGEPYELSLFMLKGELEIVLAGDTILASPGDGIHVEPRTPLGVSNKSDFVAVFVLTFSPAPPIKSVEELK